MTKAEAKRIANEPTRYVKSKKAQESAFYNMRSILGNTWAEFFIVCGPRQCGKTYSLMETYIKQFLKYGRVFYWFRLTEEACKKLCSNNAEKLIDPPLVRKYKLDIITNGFNIYNVTKRDSNGKVKERKLMCRVQPISTFYKSKGESIFDHEYDDWINVGVDEFQPEKGERRTFDYMYSFVNAMETYFRNRKEKLRIVCLANAVSDASDLLCAFNFIPEKFGRFKLRKKRCIIDNIEPNEAYKEMRAGSIADILMPDASTFTNKTDNDYSLVNRKRLIKPNQIIKFKKDPTTWFTIWDSGVICKYNKERLNNEINMRPYQDGFFSTQLRDQVIELFDTRCYEFKDLITFKKFQQAIELIKPRK